MSDTVSIETILKTVSGEYQVTILDLRSDRRDRRVAAARRAGYWLARHLTRHSSPSIGRMFGNRDHTTVLYGVSRMDRMVEAGEPEGRRALALMSRLERAAS